MLSRTALRSCIRGPRLINPIIRTYVAQPATPSPEAIRAAAAQGVRLTPEQVSEIARREQAANPSSQTVQGGPTATAQSILTKQQQLDSKLDELVEKPLNKINEQDVGELHSAMTKGRGGKPIEKDNIVSDLHRVAQMNEGLTKKSGPLAEATKEEAAELQSEEAAMSGTGRTEKGGIAAQFQSVADKSMK
jgi:hypothetical protein